MAGIEELEALYGAPRRAALDKVADRLTPLYRRWIEASVLRALDRRAKRDGYLAPRR